VEVYSQAEYATWWQSIGLFTCRSCFRFLVRLFKKRFFMLIKKGRISVQYMW